MPRPPSFYHPLRDIRKSTDARTQASFATLIGVAPPTIQAIENGKLEISRKLAMRIERATGADHRELLKGSAGKPHSIDGKKYNSGFYKTWIDRQNSEAIPGPNSGLEQIGFWAELLMRAAEKKTADSRSETSVFHLLTEALDSVCQDCDLEAEIEKLMVPLKNVEYHASPPGKWIDDTNEPGHGLSQIQARFHPSARVVVSIEQIPRWAPGHPAPTSSSSKTSSL